MFNIPLPYPVDYNDHFETPLEAYVDIQPLIDWVFLFHDNSSSSSSSSSSTNSESITKSNITFGEAQTKKKQNSKSQIPPQPTQLSHCTTQQLQHYPQPILYDPYYCQGRTKQLLQNAPLGYTHVVHAPRDFYHDIRHGTVPYHDIFITNPPYSDVHKQLCLEYCAKTKTTSSFSSTSSTLCERPFFILVPTYVVARNYFRSTMKGLLEPQPSSLHHHHGEGDDGYVEGIVYVLPSASSSSSAYQYQYAHPDGTGHDTSPFDSLWICGIGYERAARVQEWWDWHYDSYDDSNSIHSSSSSNRNRNRNRSRRISKSPDNKRPPPRLFCSREALQHAGILPTVQRPNPRQRTRNRNRKRQQQQQQPPPPQGKKIQKKTATTITTSTATITVPVAATGIRSPRLSGKYRDEHGKRYKKRF